MYLELPQLRIHRVSAIETTEAMLLINRHPGPDEENVPLNGTVSLTILDLGTDGIDESVTRIWVDDSLAFDLIIQSI